ncbi:Pls/PosA family non-ribosomal peptide synthetase [Pseudonocardia endophytica]|uniref:Non-ribosomal peptide synthetase-like protein n=1 Tax=Pseudonocardia endophytica TaxID=401976 RepID=A0A4R1HQ08_PSEEN|nr:Pls/PosA family non-ribosomal peptide synthetase [Pseudonocardia endophytica]TCK24654.1 non-ribosomal peptide synthetase-like protein [Pseudonocardia endophytica]
MDDPTAPVSAWSGSQPDMSRVLVAGDDLELPRTFPGERLEHLWEQACDRWPESVAVDLGEIELTYAEIDGWANRMARLLRDQGIRAGDRVGLLFDQPTGGLVSMLSTLKIGASFVPMDVGFPADRIEYILDDAGATALLTRDAALGAVEGLAARAADHGVTVLSCDDLEDVRDQDPARLRDDERGSGAADDLAYVIYTSGSTGRPKGVAIEHPAICNFVRVAADEYGVRPDDRMYQGLTLAFDFSVEEIWTTWLSGATLVPKPTGVTLVGDDLQDFLTERRITAMCCVPTLLATLTPDLPDLRFLLVSGEACPQHLVRRWYRDDRRFLNVYGPTEATVTATWTSLHPDRPVTIGRPLPTYAIVVLDRDDPTRALPHGRTGEIAIAGIGLARGYLNNDEKTAASFVPDFLDLPSNPSGRLYRTGDLGRVDDRGEIEYRGRVDLQVKIRGYRIELTEIESVLLGADGVTQAVVDTYEAPPGNPELVGYYSARPGEPAPDRDAIRSRLREQLPAYMVPSYLEQLDVIPMTTQDKADRTNLPAPTTRVGAPTEHVEPDNDVERGMAEALAEALGVEEVSVTADFFDELGATSLLMAGFTAAVRRRDDLPTVSARDVYQHPTVRDLAENLGPVAGSSAPVEDAGPVRRTGSLAHALTGLGQAVLLVTGGFAVALVLTQAYAWMGAAEGWTTLAGRAAAVASGVLVGLSLLPVVVKWLFVGRFHESTHPLWSERYLRFWSLRLLVRASPMRLAAGTPLYTLYLRMLGAHVGRGAVVFTREVPVAADLVHIGERAVIHPEVVLNGYRVVPGSFELGRVDVGADAVVGQASVLDVGTSVGDGAQLGHSSALHPGGAVPAGEVWHGSPARKASGADYRPVAPVGSGRARRAVFGLVTALFGLVAGTVVLGGATALYGWVAPRVPALFGRTGGDIASSWQFYAAGLATVVVGYTVLVTLLLAAVLVLPRLLALLVVPGRTYPLYGAHDVAQRLITTIGNSRFLVLLLGDSSFVTSYARGLGYDLRPLKQTGSNFGTQLRQDSPTLTSVGTGTMVSDGLRVMNVEFSHDSFAAREVRIGERNFVGNDVHMPAGARTGDNVLLATKVMVPVDGPVREDTGLLGSPPMEIPRSSTDRDSGAPESPEGLAAALRRKNRYNAGTVATVLGLRGLGVALGLVPTAISIGLWPTFGVLALGPAVLVGAVVLTGYSALLERAVLGFRRLRPRSCSIYDRYFWFHERLWKFYVRPILPGTPFAVWSNRLAGLRVGRRVFDDGASFPEKSLVEIGDEAVLNAGSVVQCHSLEDGRFESDRVRVGDGVTLGVRAFVHYGTSLGDGARLAADSFLLKGEQIGARESWAGNPAEPVRTATPADRTTTPDGVTTR